MHGAVAEVRGVAPIDSRKIAMEVLDQRRTATSVLHVGHASTDITPGARRRTIDHRCGAPVDDPVPVCDRLYARATAFRCGGQQAVCVTCDLLCVDRTLRGAVVQRLAEESITPEQFILGATHTHTAPTVVALHGVEPTPAEYLDFLAKAIAKTAVKALRSAKPARIALGKATVDLSVNRRQIGRLADVNSLNTPAGNVDTKVSVLKVAPLDGSSGGLLFHYGAHPLAMWDGKPKISADYPGRATAYLQGAGGFAFAQFLQGCSGDVNVKIHGGAKAADRLGTTLAEAALEAAQRAQPCRSSDISMTTRTVRLPWQNVLSVDQGRAVLEQKRAGTAPSATADNRMAAWFADLCRAHAHGPPRPHAEVIVQALRIGEAVFVALPGEVFVEIAQEIERRAQSDRLVITGYCNDCQVGYLPTASAFDEGGYEVDKAPYYYGVFRLSPACAPIIVAGALEAIQAVG